MTTNSFAVGLFPYFFCLLLSCHILLYRCKIHEDKTYLRLLNGKNNFLQEVILSNKYHWCCFHDKRFQSFHLRSRNEAILAAIFSRKSNGLKTGDFNKVELILVSLKFFLTSAV